MLEESPDALLKSIEERVPGIVFCFATTEPNGIRRSLLSRLHEVRVYPIGPREAYEYLEWIARQKNLAFDPDALHFLVAAKPPYVRDLVIGLQELAELSQRITIDLVKENLGLQLCDHLALYMRALALGDRSKQIHAIQGWPGDVVEKRLWIERFVAAVYYNDVLGVEYIVDPLVHALADDRRDFARGLQERFRLDRESLKRLFQAMMKFWSTNTVLTVSSTHVTLGLFEATLSNGFAEATLCSSNDIASLEKSNAKFVVATDGSDEPPGCPQSSYLTASEAREIVNRASFFAQDTGEYLNTSISLIFKGGSDPEPRAGRFLRSFVQALDRSLDGRPGAFAALGILEREQGVVVARVLAHVTPEWQSDVSQLCSTSSKQGAQVVDVRFGQGVGDQSFQWCAIRDICACCDETTTDGIEIRRLLRIPRSNWRVAGPVAGKRAHFSERLSKKYIEHACFPVVQPLSAFDAAASRWIDSGWELREAPVRKREIAARRRRLETLHFQWRDDLVRLETERAALLESWLKLAPEQRARRWRGWW